MEANQVNKVKLLRKQRLGFWQQRMREVIVRFLENNRVDIEKLQEEVIALIPERENPSQYSFSFSNSCVRVSDLKGKTFLLFSVRRFYSRPTNG